MPLERKRLEVPTKARNVVLRLGTGLGGDRDQIDASLVRKKSGYDFIPLAFACAPFARCRIHKSCAGDVSVWIGGTAFEVSADQALLVHKTVGIPVDPDGAPL